MKALRVSPVDGSEILRLPVEVGSLSHYLEGLGYIQTVVVNGISAINTSTSRTLVLAIDILWMRYVRYTIPKTNEFTILHFL